MKTFVLSLDPGNHCGITFGYLDTAPQVTSYDFTPKSGTKKRAPEPKHKRFGSLWQQLSEIRKQYVDGSDHEIRFIIICEGAAGFTKGKSAVEVSNKYRGVVEAFAAVHADQYIPIQPADLQRFATGKGRAEKTEMLQVATEKYGYKGVNDDEADSLLLWMFVREQALKATE